MTEDARDPAQDLLATRFPAPDLSAWRSEAKRALRLAADDDEGLERALVRTTLDGIARGPLTTRADRPDATAASGAPRPLRAPSAWDIRQAVSLPDPAAANAAAREELAGGATSLELRIDPSGVGGVMVRGPDDLARVLDGLPADCPISLDARDAGKAAAVLLLDHWSRANLPAASRRGALNLDPFGPLARGRATANDAEAALDDAAAFAERLNADGAAATVLRADGRAVHEAGGSEAWEIAAAAAAGVAGLERLVARGMSIEAALERIQLALALDADVHLGVAKLHALRRVWRRIAEAAGGSAPAGAIHACSSHRMLARRDPWTNLMRLTLAGFAAAVGGAEAITLAPFTDAIGPATPFARRLSRNVQIVLAEEAGLAGAPDPAQGSFHHEALAEALAERAWTHFQDVARHGGLTRFIAEGRLREAVAAARAEREARVARREDVLVGVSDYVAFDVRDADVETSDRVAQGPVPSPPSGAAADGLPQIRLAAPFEALAEAADAHAARTGSRPFVFLATLGAPPDFRERAGWARRLLAAGGLETRGGDAYESEETLLAAYQADASPVAILCGPDALYASRGADATTLLVGAGAKVWLVGRPGALRAGLSIPEMEAELIARHLHPDADALAALGALHAALGVRA